MQALGYIQITDLSAAVGLTSPPLYADVAFIECEGQSVRWRDDGTSPTASVGMILSPGDVLTYDNDLSKIKFIQVAASAKLNVSYYDR